MRPTQEYLNERFAYYNRLCFGGLLPVVPLQLNTRFSQMGVTRWHTVRQPDGSSVATDVSIEISVRHDRTAEDYDNTLVHEMIHLYILANRLDDDSPHGRLFRAKQAELNSRYGLHITTCLTPSVEELIAGHSRTRYVCTAELTDGRSALAVVARGKVWELWDAISKLPGVESVTWYVSDRSIFATFPTVIEPDLLIIDDGTLRHYLTGARQLQRLGNTIRLAQDT